QLARVVGILEDVGDAAVGVGGPGERAGLRCGWLCGRRGRACEERGGAEGKEGRPQERAVRQLINPPWLGHRSPVRGTGQARGILQRGRDKRKDREVREIGRTCPRPCADLEREKGGGRLLGRGVLL